MTGLNLVPITDTPAQHPNSAVPRDGRVSPLIYPAGGGAPVAHTRVTTFVDAVEDKSNLAKYGERNVLIGLATNPSLLEGVRELGIDTTRNILADDDEEAKEVRKKLHAIAEKAKVLSGANWKARQGDQLHLLTECEDQFLPLPDDTSEDHRARAAAYTATVAERGLWAEHIEQFLVVPELQVAGTTDRVYRYNGILPDGRLCTKPIIGDVKTGTLDYGALKMAAQLAVYSRGRTYDFIKRPVRAADERAWAAWKKEPISADEAASMYGPALDVETEWGVIMHLPSLGEPVCTPVWINLRIGWEVALAAQRVREVRKLAGDVFKPWDETL